MFLKQTSNSLPLSPLGHSDGFASCKARRVLISASLPKTPFPGKGGFYWGYRPLTKQGCLQSATQSHCTMQWHKWLTTCTGALPLRPHFLINKNFFNSLMSLKRDTLFTIVNIITYLLYHFQYRNDFIRQLRHIFNKFFTSRQKCSII